MKRLALSLGVVCLLGTLGGTAVAQQLSPQLLKADRVVVEKSKRLLTLSRRGEALRTYRVALGPTPAGHKQRQGDGRTPEGSYLIDWRNPQSKFYLSLHISYPNEQDRARAAALGVPPGGAIMIHGLGRVTPEAAAEHPGLDWTEGCIAVTNREIEEIWQLVDNGTPIEILP